MNLKIYDNIKKLFNHKSKLKNSDSIDNVDHGFKLTIDDAGAYLKNFLSASQLRERVHNINNIGYMHISTGNMLKSFIKNSEYDTYVKSVHSSDIDSIMEEGIRCLGNSSSIGSTNPNNITDISLQHSITKVDDLTILVELVKKHNGFSQGFNKIDGTIILQIPKNISKQELFCYNETSKTYNIRPDFIIGFIPVDENHNVKGLITSINEIESNKTL